MQESDVKNLIVTELKNYVNHPLCQERHKEVTAVSDWVKRLDARLWALVLIGVGQLAATVISLIKGIK